MIYLLLVMPRDLLARSTLGVLGKAAVASAAMALVLFTLHGQSLGLLIPVGCIVYALVGLALRLVAPEDIRLIGGAIRRRGRLPEAEESQA